MLLTLSVASLRNQLQLGGSTADEGLDPMEVPALAIREFDLHGLHLPTWLFKGWDASQVDAFRDRADKAGCPCLVLAEETPHPMSDEDDDAVAQSVERMERVLRVAHRLGCSSAAMSLTYSEGEDAWDFARENLRDLVKRAERLELNLLLQPTEGLTGTPDSLTSLIRDVGGFRIGSCPSFAAAGASGDPAAYLKAVTPYASAVVAHVGEILADGSHEAFDLGACVEAVRAVGYDGSVAIEPTEGDVFEQIGRCKDALATLLETENA
jgi:sugar phosphate isomerase/epimerase